MIPLIRALNDAGFVVDTARNGFIGLNKMLYTTFPHSPLPAPNPPSRSPSNSGRTPGDTEVGTGMTSIRSRSIDECGGMGVVVGEEGSVGGAECEVTTRNMLSSPVCPCVLRNCESVCHTPDTCQFISDSNKITNFYPLEGEVRRVRELPRRADRTHQQGLALTPAGAARSFRLHSDGHTDAGHG